MPHPEQEHALMIEVATLTRQRDDMERIGNAKIAKWQSRAEKAESERDALHAEVKRLRGWMESKAAYYAEDSKELKADAANLVRTDAEAAMFRSGCADYAAGFATELRAALAYGGDRG